MNDTRIFSIGKIENNDEKTCIKLDPKYSAGLKGLMVNSWCDYYIFGILDSESRI